MSLADLSTQFAAHWREAVEILLLAAGIYGLWLLVRAARGARVLIGIGICLVVLMLGAQLLELRIVSWVLRSLSTFLAFALVVIFQPELRRGLAALGSHRFLSLGTQSRESVAILEEATFELANRQLGALIAVERETGLEHFAESGVTIDAALSAELLVTIFHPKTPLHDGGVIIRADRIVSAAAIFPVSQRTDLDRNLGLRHRAGLGLTEESDAVLIVVSEETGIVSICHRGMVERNFDPEGFKRRLDELLNLAKEDQAARASTAAREERSPRSRRQPLGAHAEESRDDRVAF
jgi:diadenylate cyclase